MSDFSNYVLGAGTLAINGVDVGYIEGGVKVRKGVETVVSEGGVPMKRRGSRVKKETFELEVPLGEFTAENMETVLGIVPTEVSGTETTVTAEALTFAVTGFTPGVQAIKLGDSNKRSQFVTISSGGDAPVITNSGATVTYTENDDYIVDYSTGYVYRNPGGAITSLQAVKATYKYTPPASAQFKIGANTTIPNFTLSFVHEDPETGQKITAYMHKAEADPSVEWEFKDDAFVITNGKFYALDDSANHATDPLGYLLKEE